ncbi:adhesion domain-containing protein [Aeromonas sanarellii]
MTPDGTVLNFSDAVDYCAAKGGRLPTKDELQELYNAYPTNQISSVCGWPSGMYRSSSEYGPNYHYAVNLSIGNVYAADDYDGNIAVTCVR